MTDTQSSDFDAQRFQFWLGFHTAILVGQQVAGRQRDPHNIIRAIGDTIKATFKKDNAEDTERPTEDRPIAEHLAFAKARAGAAERAIVSGTCGNWMLPYQVVDVHTTVYDIGETLPFTAELEDEMAAQMLRDVGLGEFCTGELSAGDFASFLAMVWSGATFEYTEEDAPSPTKRPLHGSAIILPFTKPGKP